MSYTLSDYKTAINKRIHGKKDMLLDFNDSVNTSVRNVISDIDLRSTRRRADISPKLFTDIYDYACPSDLKGYKIIDVPAQVKRAGDWFLVPSEEFDRKKSSDMLAIDDYNGSRVLRLAANIDDDTVEISTLDSLTAGDGTWMAFGDAESLVADTDDYVKESGSIKFNISSAGGTTAGIQNTGLNSFDITDYLGGNSSIFVWHKINSATNITNYILRIGNDASNYYSKTITTKHDGTAFEAGWNLLRFDLTSLTEIGTVDDTAIDYVAIYMTKTAGKISESDYKFDYLVLKKGEIHRILYYSKYGWKTSGGTYIENSTDDSDILIADTDEFELLVEKGIEDVALELDDEKTSIIAGNRYKEKKAKYEMENFSEAKLMTNEYYVF